ncbi:MAG: ribonuclease P protein component [Ruminococcus sp.]|nr:ribonuclease P protein component [Ruminococcus sp.]
MNKVSALKENRDFSRLYRKGKSEVCPVLVTYFQKNRSDTIRFGITTGKKIGNAVKRNRARRIIRAAFRELSPMIKDGYDFVFVARGKTPFVKSSDIKKAMLKQFKENNLI